MAIANGSVGIYLFFSNHGSFFSGSERGSCILNHGTSLVPVGNERKYEGFNTPPIVPGVGPAGDVDCSDQALTRMRTKCAERTCAAAWTS